MRAFVAPAGPAVARSGMGGSGAAARGVGGGLALAPTPELLDAVDALPPADDDPEVDVVAEAAASEGFRLRAFLRPYRRPLLVGFALIVVDTLLTLAGPFLVQQGLNEGVQQHADGRAAGPRRRCSSARRWSTGSSRGRTRGTPAAPPNGCCSRCASGSSPTCNGSRSTTTTASCRAGS